MKSYKIYLIPLLCFLFSCESQIEEENTGLSLAQIHSEKNNYTELTVEDLNLKISDIKNRFFNQAELSTAFRPLHANNLDIIWNEPNVVNMDNGLLFFPVHDGEEVKYLIRCHVEDKRFKFDLVKKTDIISVIKGIPIKEITPTDLILEAVAFSDAGYKLFEEESGNSEIGKHIIDYIRKTPERKSKCGHIYQCAWIPVSIPYPGGEYITIQYVCYWVYTGDCGGNGAGGGTSGGSGSSGSGGSSSSSIAYSVPASELDLGGNQIGYRRISFVSSSDQAIIDHYMRVLKIYCDHGTSSNNHIDWRNYFTSFGHTQVNYSFEGRICLDDDTCFDIQIVPYNGVSDTNWHSSALNNINDEYVSNNRFVYRFHARHTQSVNLNIYIPRNHRHRFAAHFCL